MEDMNEDSSKEISSNGHQEPATPGELSQQEKVAAQVLVQRIKSVTGLSFRVYRMNEIDWVAATSIKRARKWYLEFSGQEDPVIDEPLRDIPLKTEILCDGDTRKPLWLLIAEHLKEGVLDWDAEMPFPVEIFEPYVIASTEV
jgi:hypothetical protein